MAVDCSHRQEELVGDGPIGSPLANKFGTSSFRPVSPCLSAAEGGPESAAPTDSKTLRAAASSRSADSSSPTKRHPVAISSRTRFFEGGSKATPLLLALSKLGKRSSHIAFRESNSAVGSGRERLQHWHPVDRGHAHKGCCGSASLFDLARTQRNFHERGRNLACLQRSLASMRARSTAASAVSALP